MKTHLWAGVQTVILGLVIWGMPGQESVHASVTVVVPNSQATTEGNDADDFTFSIISPGFPPSVRFQQLYPASQFTALSGPMRLTQIAFRPDGPLGTPFTATLNVQIAFSAMPDRFFVNFCGGDPSVIPLSCVFSQNIGDDNTVAFDGLLSLSSANTGPVGGPKDFDIVIKLQHPFVYDPAKGNLLLDIHNFMNVPTTFFDAQDGQRGGPVVHVDAENVNSPVGGFFDRGLVTQFQFEPMESCVFDFAQCIPNCTTDSCIRECTARFVSCLRP